MSTETLIDFINGEEINYQTLAQLNKFDQYIKGMVRPEVIAKFHQEYYRAMESEREETDVEKPGQTQKCSKPWFLDYVEISYNSSGLIVYKCKLCTEKGSSKICIFDNMDSYVLHAQSVHKQFVREQNVKREDGVRKLSAGELVKLKKPPYDDLENEIDEVGQFCLEEAT